MKGTPEYCEEQIRKTIQNLQRAEKIKDRNMCQVHRLQPGAGRGDGLAKPGPLALPTI